MYPRLQFNFMLFGPKLLQSDPEKGRKLLRAIFLGNQRFLAGETPVFLREFIQSSRLDQDVALRGCRDGVTATGSVNPKHVQSFIDWAASKGYCSNPLQASDLIDDRFLKPLEGSAGGTMHRKRVSQLLIPAAFLILWEALARSHIARLFFLRRRPGPVCLELGASGRTVPPGRHQFMAPVLWLYPGRRQRNCVRDSHGKQPLVMPCVDSLAALLVCTPKLTLLPLLMLFWGPKNPANWFSYFWRPSSCSRCIRWMRFELSPRLSGYCRVYGADR